MTHELGILPSLSQAISIILLAMIIPPIAVPAAMPGGATEASGPAVRIASIEKEYRQTIAPIKTARDAEAIGRIARARRDVELEKVFAEADLMDPVILSVEDARSLAAAAESIRRPDECVKYCRLALARGASLDQTYLPWLRTLIAADRLAEAERDLTLVEPKLAPTSFVHQMHLFLSLKYFVNQHDAAKAVGHIDTYFDWVTKNLDFAPVLPHSMASHLKHYLDVHRALNTDKEALLRLQEFQQLCVAPRLTGKARAPGSNTVDMQLLMIHYLNCELWGAIDADELAAAEAQRLESLFDTAPEAWSSEPFLREVQRFGQSLMMRSQAMKYGDLAALVRALAVAGDKIEQVRFATPDEKTGVARLMTNLGQQIKVFESVLEREQARLALIGKPFSGWSGATWLAPDTEPSVESGSTVMIHFWNPFSGAGKQSLSALKDWARIDGLPAVVVTSIVPTCGFTWDPKTHTMTQTKGMPIADEIEAWSQFLTDRVLPVATGILDSSSGLWDVYRVGARSLTVIVGPDGKIREIFEGVGRDRIRQVSEFVSNLARRGDSDR